MKEIALSSDSHNKILAFNKDMLHNSIFITLCRRMGLNQYAHLLTSANRNSDTQVCYKQEGLLISRAAGK